MSRLVWGLAVWSALFFPAELTAHFWSDCPWPTLSRTVWIGIKDWHPVAYFVALFMAVLLGHFEFEWSAGWLILLAVLGTAAIVAHVVFR